MKYLIIALGLAVMCGIEVSAVRLVSLVIYAVIIVMSTSWFTSLLVIPAYLGVPIGAIELMLGITQIIDIAAVVLDSLGAVAISVLIAGKENILSSNKTD